MMKPVSTGPGETAETVMPEPASSSCSAKVKARSRRGEIDLHDAGELLGGVALDRPALVGAGVVDEDVDAAEALGHVREETRRGLRVSDVGNASVRLACAGSIDLNAAPCPFGSGARGLTTRPIITLTTDFGTAIPSSAS